MANRLDVNIFIAVFCFVLALLGVFAAKWVAKCRQVVSVALALAAGVLLSAGMVHMLPSAEKKLSTTAGDFPLATAIAGVIYCLLLLIEDIVVGLHSVRSATSSGGSASGDGDVDACYRPLPNNGRKKMKRNSFPRVRFPIWRDVSGWLRRRCDGGPAVAMSLAPSPPLLNVAPGTAPGSCDRDEISCQAPSCGFDTSNWAQQVCASTIGSVDDLPGTCYDAPGADSSRHHCHDAGLHGGEGSVLRAACLFAALSFHSVMEGLGVGTQTKENMVILVSVAILAHKGLAAFALGVSLRKSGNLSASRFFILAVIFSASTPAGIIIGYYVTVDGESWVTGVCNAMAAGTFLQVSTVEMIPSALKAPGPGGRAMSSAAILAGFSVFSVLALWC